MIEVFKNEGSDIEYDEELYSFVEKYFGTHGYEFEVEYSAGTIYIEHDRDGKGMCISDKFFEHMTIAYSNLNELDDACLTINMEFGILIIYYRD